MAKTVTPRPAVLHVPELIARKRDGEQLDAADLRRLIEGYAKEQIPDYQMSAFAMAVYLRGMSRDETVALTKAMRDSGRVLRFEEVAAVKVDKHSTGGVGDKVSICLAPLVAAAGVAVPMVSGRALGHTGGTLDKLEAIQGFRVDLSPRRFRELVRRHGLALIGQTGDIAPADRRLYALRDVTATVESIPLITASILSKKLAEGIDALVLDCKVGCGAFMKDAERARELARSVVRVGEAAGLKTTALLTAMDQPLGLAVGNSLETAEALAVLRDAGPEDLRELTLVLGIEMLRVAGVGKSTASRRRTLEGLLQSGEAAARMRELIAAQGGDPRVVDEPDRLPRAPRRAVVRASKAGYVRRVDALEIGRASMNLGAGRLRVTDPIDPSVGVVLRRKVGDRVHQGDELAEIHFRRPRDRARALSEVEGAFTVGRSAPTLPPLVLEKVS